MTVNKLTSPISQNDLINKTNEIIDNLGGGGANTDLSNLTATGEAHFAKVFIATYGTTTYQEVLNAYNAGKIIYCATSNPSPSSDYKAICLLSGYKNREDFSTGFIFEFQSLLYTSSTYAIVVYVDSNNTWSYKSLPCESSSNKVTSISSSSTDTQYPSAKSVIELLKTIYPVGSVYLSTNSTCPMASLFGTWTLVSSGKALWTGTGSNGNTTIAAGLPNIKGKIQGETGTLSGAFTLSSSFSSRNTIGGSGSSPARGEISFSAASSNSIYSDSVTTVQPPAYVVNVWRRTA